MTPVPSVTIGFWFALILKARRSEIPHICFAGTQMSLQFSQDYFVFASPLLKLLIFGMFSPLFIGDLLSVGAFRSPGKVRAQIFF